MPFGDLPPGWYWRCSVATAVRKSSLNRAPSKAAGHHRDTFPAANSSSNAAPSGHKRPANGAATMPAHAKKKNGNVIIR